MKKKTNQKLFIVRKYVYATSAAQVLRKEKNIKCDDVWIDEDWRKNQQSAKDAIGFQLKKSDESD